MLVTLADLDATWASKPQLAALHTKNVYNSFLRSPMASGRSCSGRALIGLGVAVGLMAGLKAIIL
jgi:hypothetical protein